MIACVEPATPREASEAVKSAEHVIGVGARTKPRLSAVDALQLSTKALRGIVEYEPSEFTFTALAGTPVRDIAAALAERGQYLPFDPMFEEAGATLGGTVASGLSGPGRFRFGGIRDFILGVQFVDGAGRLLRMGGKVVKNAAGFDLPKFFTGSLGRFGLLTEITFKVFPKPAARLTLKLEAPTPENAKQMMAAARSRWEPDALDWLPSETAVFLRLAGPEAALPAIAQEILAKWPGRNLPADKADKTWRDLRECSWASPDAALVKVPLPLVSLRGLVDGLTRIEGSHLHVSAGGNVAFISATSDSVGVVDGLIKELELTGMMLRGVGPLWLGAVPKTLIEDGVKTALDAENRFPSLYD
jgi:glycolate oxidase FAD binding subunit